MDLTGKTVILEVSGAVMDHFFGKEPRQGETATLRWHLIGEVVGETGGVGLWFRMTGLGIRHDSDSDPQWKPDAKSVYLIRWDWVLNALMLPEKPKDMEKMGFRPI